MAIPKVILVTLILSLLVASSCTTNSISLIASPKFVETHITRLMEVEKAYGATLEKIKFFQMLGIDLGPIFNEFVVSRDNYWVYYRAANTYLVDADLELYAQAVARAEQAVQKITDLLDKLLDEEPAETEVKPKSLSL